MDDDKIHLLSPISEDSTLTSSSISDDEEIDNESFLKSSRRRSSKLRVSVYIAITLVVLTSVAAVAFHLGFQRGIYKSQSALYREPVIKIMNSIIGSSTDVQIALQDVQLRRNVSYYTDFEESIYAGLPSPGVDGAWHQLLSNMTIRVTADELAFSNQTSVALPEGGGYMAWLGVFHELHCIKMIRQWNYRDHYHPGLQLEDQPHWDIHADHCFDLLRSAAMCRSDLTLTTFGWADQDKPMLNTRPIPRRCADWDSLTESIKYRAVSEEEVGALRNPLKNEPS